MLPFLNKKYFWFQWKRLNWGSNLFYSSFWQLLSFNNHCFLSKGLKLGGLICSERVIPGFKVADNQKGG